MTDNNKIIRTVNSITPDYEFIPDLNDVIVIDTSENRIGINTITPDVEIHVSGGTIKTENLTVLGDISVNYITSNLVPKHDLSYSLGSATHNWKDIYVGPGTIYMNNTPIIHMGESTHNGAVDISCLKIDNSGRPLDISGVNHVNIDGDISINGDLYIGGGLYVAGDISFVGNLNVLNDTIFNENVRINDSLTVLGDVSFTNSKLVVHNDSSFNKNVDISGILNMTELTNADGTETTTTKMYTTLEANSQGVMTTRFIIDPAGDNIGTNGEVVILGNLDIKGTTVYFNSTEVDISDNIIRLNANHGSVTDGGIVVTNSSSVDKLFSYNNTGDYWSTNNTNIDLGPTAGVVSAGFMNIDNISIDGNAISRIGTGDLAVNSGTGQLQITSGGDINITSAHETTIQAGTGNVVIENLTFKNNTISTTPGTDLNISASGGNIFTQNSNLDLGSGTLTVNSVENAHVPTGVIMLWYGISTNVPTGWVICNGTNGTPNLSGRFVVCSGNNNETDYTEGSSGGNDSYTLDISHIPSHNHDASCSFTDVQHNHDASCSFTDVQHNHNASCSFTDVQHSHDASCSFTDVQHNHDASCSFTDVQHSHDASNSGFTDVSHSHTGTTEFTTDTHTHPDTLVSSAEISHTHTVQVTQNDHTHTTNSSGTDADHQHVISESQAPHDHGLEFQFPYSTDENGAGTVSLMTDNQYMGNLQITQLAGFTGGVQTDNATHTHITETVDPSHSFYGQTEHLHTINQDTHGHDTTVAHHTTQHDHTLSLAPGGNPHNHTMTIDQANINHSHELQIESASIDHNHVIQTQQTSIDHNHVIQTQQTSIDHKHEVQIAEATINHNHEVLTAQASISHNHIIEIADTGGGIPLDNRPKWYSLWYIMKV
jgi:hypothetical protein